MNSILIPCDTLHPVEPFTCDCGHVESPHSSYTRGFGTDPNTGKTLCLECCAAEDIRIMEEDGRIVLYLTKDTVTNWPGTLKFPVQYQTKGKHNIARTRYDVWFRDAKKALWHGVQYGEFTQLCHCRRVKG